MIGQNAPGAALGPVGGALFNTSGTASGLTPTAEGWIVIALFGLGILALLVWGFIGGQLDVRASGGAGRAA